MRRVFIFVLFFFFLSGLSADEMVLFTDPWPPYYYEEDDNGLTVLVVRAALEAVGYELRVEFMPWKRVLIEAGLGKSDGILGGFYNKEREAEFLYSEPVGDVQIVLFQRSYDAEIRYDSLEDLCCYRIGTIAGYSYSPEFDAAEYLDKIPVYRTDSNILKLESGRIDLFVEAKAVAFYWADRLLPERSRLLKALHPPLVRNDLYVLISKKTPEAQIKLEALNRGLGIIKENGTYEEIMSR